MGKSTLLLLLVLHLFAYPRFGYEWISHEKGIA